MKRLTIFCYLLYTTTSVGAQGILLSDYRIHLHTQKVHTLQVCNPTEEARIVSLSLDDKGMSEEGALLHYPDSTIPAFSLRNNVRFFPRSVRLEPRGCQEVQLQARGVNNLADGEYRVYLVLSPRTIVPDLVDEQENTQATSNTAINIEIKVAGAIPIMFRKNACLDSCWIEPLELDTSSSQPFTLKLRIHKNGTQSTYGRIRVQAHTHQQNTVITESAPEVLYGEMSKKKVTVDIPPEVLRPIINKTNITLSIQYINCETQISRSQSILAETTFPIRRDNLSSTNAEYSVGAD